MNLQYLITNIIPQRKKEIESGENACTSDPIYVVLDLQENITSDHTDYSLVTNHKGKEAEIGYIDVAQEPEDRVFKTSHEGMECYERVTLFYTDRIVAFFLTKQAAKDYLQYQKHNMNDPYIFVFNIGYANKEMLNVFKNSTSDEKPKKILASKATNEHLQEVLRLSEAEIEALNDTRTRIENELSQRKNPELDYGLIDFYIDNL